MNILKNKKSLELGLEQIIIILILIFFLIAVIVWYLDLGDKGSFLLAKLFKR